MYTMLRTVIADAFLSDRKRRTEVISSGEIRLTAIEGAVKWEQTLMGAKEDGSQGRREE